MSGIQAINASQLKHELVYFSRSIGLYSNKELQMIPVFGLIYIFAQGITFM